MAYGNVYVAQVAIGANDIQTVKALLEAEAWPGPSLVIAYSTCIAHGIDMSHVDVAPEGRRASRVLAALPVPPGRRRARASVPARQQGPAIPLAEFAATEGRFSMLARSDPGDAAELLALAQADVDERWRYYRQLAGIERTIPHVGGGRA